jgi:membrane associated rhomboid family serine protease
VSSSIRRTFARRGDARAGEPRLEPNNWGGALVVILAFAAVLWGVQIINAAQRYSLNRFGLIPHEAGGLWGVVTEPFLHASYAHLFSNTLPLLAIGWVVLLAGLRIWLIVTGIVVIVGGLLTWLVGPSHTVIVGASGLVFGWLGYLLGRAIFARKMMWIIIAVVVLIFFGSLLYELFPSANSDVSWQAHVCGFVAGVGAAALLHTRPGVTWPMRRSAVR